MSRDDRAKARSAELAATVSDVLRRQRMTPAELQADTQRLHEELAARELGPKWARLLFSRVMPGGTSTEIALDRSAAGMIH